MAELVVAVRSARVRSGGTLRRVLRGRSVAHPDAEVVRGHPDLWEPLVVDFPADDVPPAAVPSAKDIRVWARERGIDVPARGKVPDDITARYVAERES